MSAFTKGPWLLGDENDACCDVVIGETVASFDRESPYTGKRVISREEMLANAHLTIAAPDMYEALKRIAEGNLGPAAWQADYDKVREIARAALAKAVPK